MALMNIVVNVLITIVLFLTSALLAGPVPAPSTISEIDIPPITLPLTTFATHTLSIPTDVPNSITATAGESINIHTTIHTNVRAPRTCNKYGCGLKCKSSHPCSQPLTVRSCPSCLWYAAGSGPGVEKWDLQCLMIQWDLQPAKKC